MDGDVDDSGRDVAELLQIRPLGGQIGARKRPDPRPPLARVAAVLARAAAYVLGMLALAGVVAPPAGASAPYVEQFPPLLAPWTRSVSTTAPLPEYPRPELERSSWSSLNGRWEYEQGQQGEAPPFGLDLAQTILVPFAPESPLSGIGREDDWGWYRREFTVPASWRGQHVQLNFGAVSWQARVYVNGKLAGSHVGDYDSFSLDITSLLNASGPNELLVGYYDPVGAAGEPVGKQRSGIPRGIFHTPSSGIWQTVWLEPVSPEHVTALDLVPDLAGGRLTVTAAVTGGAAGRVVAQALAGSRVVATGSGRPGQAFSIPIPDPHAWSPSDPYLYGLRLELLGARGQPLDQVESYFGMRSIALGRVGGATRILLNGQFVFESGALDQGYWPDGVYTPSADEAIRADILAAKNLGYNMLREHQKLEPDRWYYWADKLGILVWQDMPTMRAPGGSPTPAEQSEFRRELAAIVEQRRSDPSIVAWVPFNEGWDQFDPSGVASEIKRLDRSALVDSDSGSANCCSGIEAPNTDIRDTHLYTGPFSVAADRRATVVGEYGGVLAYPSPAHRWPGVLTSLGSPVEAWGPPPVEGVIRAQYAELQQEMRVRGLSAAVFTELAGYEDELGIITYDRGAYTIPAQFVRGLNQTLIAASQRTSNLSPQQPAVPPGTTGLWTFGAGQGSVAYDGSGYGHTLTLAGGASWSRDSTGSALRISGPGQYALSAAPLIDTSRSFTISAWLNYGVAGESGSAVTEPGPDGSSFSLGVETAPLGPGGKPGAGGLPGKGTRWTFIVPNGSACTAAQCGVRANMRYNDGRNDPAPGRWHQVTAVYDRGSATIRLYVDGVPEDVEHVWGIPPETGPLVVGAGTGNYGPPDTFIGSIQDLRIYSRSLTPGEVWQLYGAEPR
jgi:Concanavalin A-like lectin/glucanases superfamily/Glycosyl hydrolases family 2, sugar binding domain/Glycosyl hydrolases family 2